MWEDSKVHVITTKYVTIKYMFIYNRALIVLNDKEKVHFSALILHIVE